LHLVGLADILVSMKKVSKRELVRNPSLASHLKPGQSLELEDGKEPLVVSRRKRVRLTAKEIHAELDRLCEGAPSQDSQAALRDLRQQKQVFCSEKVGNLDRVNDWAYARFSGPFSVP
jgi:hypothetical protein